MAEDDIASLLVPLTTNQLVFMSALSKLGQHVQFDKNSPGQCQDFVFWALDQAKAEFPTDKDLRRQGRNVWGTKIKIEEVIGGDILQIGKYVMDLKQVVEYTVRGDKKTIVYPYHDELHHHTAIVEDMMDLKTGFIPVFEQMLVGGKQAAWLVRESGYYTRNLDAFVTKSYDHYFVMRVEFQAKGEVTSTLTVKVKGKENIVAYRPIPRK
jgi:hypothetical protein